MRVVPLAVALVGCGDGIAALDAPPPPDGDVGLVRMRYLTGGPAGGHRVYFQNRDSSVVQVTRTDDAGRANAFMAPHGFVTLVDALSGTSFLYTYADVLPGDELVIDRGAFTPQTSFLFRIAPAPNDAVFYQLETTCGGSDVRGAEVSSIEVTLNGCEPTTDLLVLAFGTGTSYVHRADVRIDQGFVDLRAPYQPLQPATVAVVDVPPSVGMLFATHGLVGGRRLLYGATGFFDVLAGTGQTSIEVPIVAGTTMTTVLDPAELGQQHVIDWRPASAATTIDYDEVVVRGYLEAPRYEPTRSLLEWREDTAGEPANLVLSSFQWFDPEAGNRVWTVASPRGAEPILRIPVLPDPHLVPGEEIFGPQVHASILATGDLAYARTHLIGRWQPGAAWPVDGPAGRVVFRDIAQ